MNKTKVALLTLSISAVLFSVISCDKDEDKKEETTNKEIHPTISGTIAGYKYVDLGLKSGLKWAIYNVGANRPEDYGEYFAWGEILPKEDYTWANYKFEAESYKGLSYSSDGNKGFFNGCSKYAIADGVNLSMDSVAWYDSKGIFIGDSLMTLLEEDDAATVNWGADWRMPTLAEQQELLDGCSWEYIKDLNGCGIAGYIGTSKVNGHVIFLPAAGSRYGTGLDLVGSIGLYWSSTLGEDYTYNACELGFQEDEIYWGYNWRLYGGSIRAVSQK